MRERDFDKGYKSGFQFGKEVANVEWLNKIKQAYSEIENLSGQSCMVSDGVINEVLDILDKLIESEEK